MAAMAWPEFVTVAEARQLLLLRDSDVGATTFIGCNFFGDKGQKRNERKLIKRFIFGFVYKVHLYLYKRVLH
jgi:hypothetical protein